MVSARNASAYHRSWNRQKSNRLQKSLIPRSSLQNNMNFVIPRKIELSTTTRRCTWKCTLGVTSLLDADDDGVFDIRHMRLARLTRFPIYASARCWRVCPSSLQAHHTANNASRRQRQYLIRCRIQFHQILRQPRSLRRPFRRPP